MVGKLGDVFAEKQYYTVLFPNANLFSTGTRVSYAGLPVGHVSGVELRSEAAGATAPDVCRGPDPGDQIWPAA